MCTFNFTQIWIESLCNIYVRLLVDWFQIFKGQPRCGEKLMCKELKSAILVHEILRVLVETLVCIHRLTAIRHSGRNPSILRIPYA